MKRNVQVVVYRNTREVAIVQLVIDDEVGTHADVYRMAAEKADEGDKEWILKEQYIDNVQSHFEFLNDSGEPLR